MGEPEKQSLLTSSLRGHECPKQSVELLSHGRIANAARAAGNFVANNAHAFWGNKRICSTLTSFAFLRAKYCHVAVHQAKNDILI
ncbi:MAG: hypothetical protein IJU92_09225 [Spirochaetaceae bacterium]|nr:hypothetical protein [Spirochaetaceae bacterium]